MSADAPTLRRGELRLQLAPAAGGSIARFDRVTGGDVVPLMRGATGRCADALESACFPLVPFANRIRGGRFVCDGREVRLSPNMPPDASPLHGQGWRAAWTLEHADAASARMAFEHDAGEWPWSYRATLQLALDDRGLSVTLACENRSRDRMPCGLGLHPYFPCSADTLLDADVDGAWTVDADVLPVARVAATGRYGLRQRRICGQGLDNGFDGWRGVARIAWPDRGIGLRIASPDADRFQVYSPAAGGLFVAEPVTNANAALNEPQERWAALGIRWLECGQTMTLSARFDPEPIDPGAGGRMAPAAV